MKASFALSIPRTGGIVARELCIGVATAAIRIGHKVPEFSSGFKSYFPQRFKYCTDLI
jgi:hypothetical protein